MLFIWPLSLSLSLNHYLIEDDMNSWESVLMKNALELNCISELLVSRGQVMSVSVRMEIKLLHMIHTRDPEKNMAKKMTWHFWQTGHLIENLLSWSNFDPPLHCYYAVINYRQLVITDRGNFLDPDCNKDNFLKTLSTSGILETISSSYSRIFLW